MKQKKPSTPKEQKRRKRSGLTPSPSDEYRARKRRGHPLVAITLSRRVLKELDRLGKEYGMDRSSLVGYLTIFHVGALKNVYLGHPSLSEEIDKKEKAA